MKIATIARDTAHSPQMVEQDAAILRCIEQELSAMGHSVTCLNEKEDFGGYDAICHMTRNHTTLQRLKRAEANGCRVINSPVAVENCSRMEFMSILRQNNIPQPPYTVLTSNSLPATLQYPGWIKKGYGWSKRKEDIAFVTNDKEAAEATATIGGTAVFCNHIEGDVVKFYGVAKDFFAHCYPNPEKTKFGWERVNGTPKHHPFDVEQMKSIAFAAAKAVGLDIFGGDCIVTPQGKIFIIDINDFPSFSAVRREAAHAIAKTIVKDN